MNKKIAPKSSPEARERAVHMVRERRACHPFQWAAIESIAAQIGCASQTLFEWIRKQETDTGQRVFRSGGARPPLEILRSFVDQHRATHGVEPICRVLQIAPSGYWPHAAPKRNPQLSGASTKREQTLMPKVQQVWQNSLQVFPATS